MIAINSSLINPMSHRILNVPPDCDELKEFIELFKFQSEKETYVRHTLLHIKQKWGVELSLVMDSMTPPCQLLKMEN